MGGLATSDLLETTKMSKQRGLIFQVLLLTTLTLGSILSHPTFNLQPSNDECELSSQGIYVCLSSEAETLIDNSLLRWIEVHWWGIQNPTEDDYVGVWDHDPMVDPSNMVESFSVEGDDGGVTTSLRFDGSLYPEVVPDTSVCLPFWGGYVKNGTVVYSSCFMLRPRWMFEIKDAIQDYGLSEVSLPGAHDAGAYGSTNNLVGEEVGKWTFTQDETFWQQLIHGTRYFDMRVSYYDETTEKFFVNHGDVRIRPLVTYLEDISMFLAETDEIIVFDIHSFEHSFDKFSNAKPDLTELLLSYFQDWMVPQSLAPNPLLSDIWNTGKQIIVTYPNQETYSDLIWNKNVHHVWGDVNSLEDLYDYMSVNIPKETGNGFLWSAMTELTPSAMDITLNRLNGLRGAANITNEPVTLWLRREWWSMVNIIAMDFISSSDVINTVIEANLKKYECNINKDNEKK